MPARAVSVICLGARRAVIPGNERFRRDIRK
jgi:hypothetical protein